jgi:acyl carrier protein
MQELRYVVAHVLQMPVEEISDDLKRGDGNWDSFNHLMLIAEVEREMGISFDVDEPGGIETFRDLLDLVTAKS